ncbi:MAG: pantetheine-phosphate adenylyltransferase [Magnetococcales bacterium]|nr:pantetheine-phosphate adenylyltransferase [Magnetococcales bacterium]
MKKTAVYPGTFDPVTLGHLDVIARGNLLFDDVIVAIADNTAKTALFSVSERIAFLEEATRDLPRVRICRMDGLLIHFVREIGACTILRGLRAVSDFEYEFQMAAMNRKLNAQVETVFLMASESTTYISSRLVKEVAKMGGDVSPFVPAAVLQALRARLKPSISIQARKA